MAIKIGTAGWTIPRDVADQFPDEGTSLERYAARFPVAEINSSFHRSHRRSTWERWRDSVSAAFRFSVKLPKTITHQRKLASCSDLIADFMQEAELLGDKLAVLLVQLPPKLEFEPQIAQSFFEDLRRRTHANIACEPRHVSWFDGECEALLTRLEVSRVAADPAICEAAAAPGAWPALAYWRLHGSPIMYRSSYGDRMGELAGAIGHYPAQEAWCIFDNTASSAAAANALALQRALDAWV